MLLLFFFCFHYLYFFCWVACLRIFPCDVCAYVFYLDKQSDCATSDDLKYITKVVWINFILPLCPFWCLKIWSPLTCIDKNSRNILRNIFCVPQVWNIMRVSKWWQNVLLGKDFHYMDARILLPFRNKSINEVSVLPKSVDVWVLCRSLCKSFLYVPCIFMLEHKKTLTNLCWKHSFLECHCMVWH